MKAFARKCSATGVGMNKGFVFRDGEMYFSTEELLIKHLRSLGDEAQYLYLFKSNGKLGLLNNFGEIVFEPKFDSIEKISYAASTQVYRSRSFRYKNDHFFGNHPRLLPESEFDVEKVIKSTCTFKFRKSSIEDTLVCYSTKTTPLVFIPFIETRLENQQSLTINSYPSGFLKV